MRSLALLLLATTVHAEPSAAEQQRFHAALDRGQKAAQAGKLDEAIAAYDDALKAIPDEPDALAEKGLVELRKKDYKRAEADTRLAIAHATKPAIRGGALYNLGLIQEALGDPAAAKVSYGESLRARSSHAVRERLATLDAALAASFDPFAPQKLSGPFKDVEAACEAKFNDETRRITDCGCADRTEITIRKPRLAAPFKDIAMTQRKCAGDEMDLLVRVGAGWYSLTVNPAYPNSSPGHCGHTMFAYTAATMRGNRLAIEYTSAGSCFHKANEWGWDERSVALIGVGPSGTPSGTPITVKLLGTDGNHPPKYDREPLAALQLSWGSDGAFDLTGKMQAWAMTPGRDDADGRLGHHDLVFP